MGRQSTLFDMFGVQPADNLRVDDGASPRKRARRTASTASPSISRKKQAVQTILDAGQPVVGPVVCSTCGMAYTVGVKEDEALHKKHCTEAGKEETSGVPLTWAAEEEVAHDVVTGLKVILCEGSRPYRERLQRATEAMAGCEVAFPEEPGLVLFAASGPSSRQRTLHAVVFAKQLLPRPASGLLYCVTAVFAPKSAKCDPPPGIGSLLVQGVTEASVFTVRNEQVGLVPSLSTHPFFSHLSLPVCSEERTSH